jgi:hypothetical protein
MTPCDLCEFPELVLLCLCAQRDVFRDASASPDAARALPSTLAELQ